MPSDLQAIERSNNIASILRVLRIRKKATRRELMEHLQLSWGCVSELIGILIDRQILIEVKDDTAVTKGRTPTTLMLSDRIKALGIDVNNLTPLEALNKLNEIKKIVRGK